jgi:hypothetical protein
LSVFTKESASQSTFVQWQNSISNVFSVIAGSDIFVLVG